MIEATSVLTGSLPFPASNADLALEPPESRRR
jgi:hypothetical protein